MGVCLSDEQRQHLKPGNYRVYIDSTLAPGHLTYGEVIIRERVNQKFSYLQIFVIPHLLTTNFLDLQ